MSKRVWIVQCRCPGGHAMMANAGVAESARDAEQTLGAALRDTVAGLLAAGIMNPWCGLCNAPAESWRYEAGRTRFTSLAEAEPALREEERAQAVTRQLWGDLHKTNKPQ